MPVIVPEVAGWLRALEQRHLASLTTAEVARGLRALSSCYVERRGRLAEGGALSSAGKRAAFALFYGPLHFLVVTEILGALGAGVGRVVRIVDLGCGTGVAGAAWSFQAGRAPVAGIERHPWALAEAAWTWRQLEVTGRTVRGDVARVRLDVRQGTGIVAAFSMNELADEERRKMLEKFVAAHARGAQVLIVEPIARTITRWWSGWQEAVARAGGRSDEWRFPAELAPLQRRLATGAGLNPTELTARTLYLPGH